MIVQALQRSRAIQMPFPAQSSTAFVEPAAFIFTPPGQHERYTIHCYIDPKNVKRQNEYQRLRAQTFVDRLGWNIPVDSEGRERDHYDQRTHEVVGAHCVYGMDRTFTEHLLAGIRVFQLRDWHDSMVMNEFRSIGMIPEVIQTRLRLDYDCDELLELTRFCVQRGRWYGSPSLSSCFNNQIARDLAYATVFAQAKYTGRSKALSLVGARYLQVMRRSNFVFREVYARRSRHHGYALIVIDLWETIRSIRASGDRQRADRMLSLCTYI